MILQTIAKQIREYNPDLNCYENLRPNESVITKYSAVLEFNEDNFNTVSNTNEVVFGRNFKLMLWADINNNEIEIHKLIEKIKFSIKTLEGTNNIWNIPLDQMTYFYVGKDKSTNQKVYNILFVMEYED